jgi:hypothetical protein
VIDNLVGVGLVIVSALITLGFAQVTGRGDADDTTLDPELSPA